MASSGSVVGPAFVGLSIRIWGFTGFCDCGVDNMAGIVNHWALQKSVFSQNHRIQPEVGHVPKHILILSF
jgi:hypothetical protein